MSQLTEFSTLAAILLGVNLAYLRLDRFQHSKNIREYASGQLQRLIEDWREIPENLKESEHYKRLSFFAGPSKGNDSHRLPGPMGRLYSTVFDSQLDRKFSVIATWLGLACVLLDAAVGAKAVSIPAIILSLPDVLLGWVLLVSLGLPLVISVALVLAGDRYISCARQVLGNDAKELGISMKSGFLGSESGGFIVSLGPDMD